MPYTISETDGQFCVYKQDEEGRPAGETLGCHATREEAETQIAAIEASEAEREEPQEESAKPQTIVHKMYSVERKDLDAFTFEAVLNTAAVDRDNQVVLPGGGDTANFMKNPVVLYAHDYESLPVARALNVSPENERLVARFQFPPEGTYDFADTVRRLWASGFLNAVSIGFVPKEWKDEQTISKWELLEFSIVPIPSNQEALRRMVKAGECVEKEGRVLSAKNRELIKAAITQTKEAVKALQELLDATEPEKGIQNAGPEPAHSDSDDELSDVLVDKLLESLSVVEEALK